MKKKLFAIIFVLILTVSGVTALAACDNAGGKAISALQTEKKYLAESTVNSGLTEEDILAQPGEYLTYHSYYVFHADGTGEYVCNKIDYRDYNIHAKYTLHYDRLDNQSIILKGYKDETDNEGIPYDYDFTDWSRLVTVSKNVLCVMGTGYTFYVNEDYVKQIPNFNKQTENK